jgi:hypothetical protein
MTCATYPHADRAVTQECAGVPCRVRGGSLSKFVLHGHGHAGCQASAACSGWTCWPSTSAPPSPLAVPNVHSAAVRMPTPTHRIASDVNAARVCAAHPQHAMRDECHGWESGRAEESFDGALGSPAVAAEASRAHDGGDRHFHPVGHHLCSLANLPMQSTTSQTPVSRVSPVRNSGGQLQRGVH